MAKYINAEVLMDAFRKYMAERYDRERCVSEESCKVCEYGCLWRRVVMNAPAADVAEVKHGEWENYPSHAHRRCSVCEMEYEKPRFNVRANFCPNCGAKMVGERE